MLKTIRSFHAAKVVKIQPLRRWQGQMEEWNSGKMEGWMEEMRDES